MEELPGFNTNENENLEDVFTKKKSNKKSSGGFQSMGLSFNVLKGITKRGYKIPTPIQRKVYMKTVFETTFCLSNVDVKYKSIF